MGPLPETRSLIDIAKAIRVKMANLSKYRSLFLYFNNLVGVTTGRPWFLRGNSSQVLRSTSLESYCFYSLPVLCGKKAAPRQVLISARADSKLRRLHDIYMLQCADVDKLDRYRYTRWNDACGGRFDGDNLSSV